MKSDRRHELQKNELADWLGERVEMLKPHATAIILGLLLLIVVIVGGLSYFTGEDSTAARSWSTYFGAFNQREPVKVLEQLVKENKGSKPALWAEQAVADMDLTRGANMLFSDRSEAKKMLERAEVAFKSVEAKANDPMLKARAQLGLGKVYESFCKPEQAYEFYAKVAAAHKDTAIGKVAANDAQRMKDQRQVELLVWFEKQQPKKPAPIPGVGGNPPGLPSDLPERPDIGLPGGLGLGNIGAGLPAAPPPALPEPAKTEPGAPKTEESKPADAKASEEKPAEPKSDTKPGDAKPGP